MKHFIVNIGCEYGSGGPDIGRMAAESLGIPFYDRDLVDQVVEKLGVDRDLVEKADSGKENVKYEFDTTFGPRYANLTNRVIYTQFEVIHKLAAKSSCVIIGRCSNYILKDRDDCLNIFVYAPDEFDKNVWTVEGEPTTTITVEKPATVELTCATVVNRIPDVIKATPGYVTTEKMGDLQFKSKMS